MGKIKINNSLLEKALLILVFGLLLFLGCSNLWANKLNHDFPYGYYASDTFQHQVRTEDIKQMGNYRNEAFYSMAGFDDVVGFYPPIMYHLGVLFSHISGLESFDSTYFVVFLFACFAALTMYLIIKQVNKNAAIISLPFMLLIFYGGAYSGFTWGHWPSLVAQFFLVAFFWAFFRIKEKGFFALAGIMLSGILLSHTSEAIFVVLFLAIYFGSSMLLKRFDFAEFKNMFFSGIIALVVSAYYLLIFYFTWMKTSGGFKFAVEKIWSEGPTLYLKDLNVLLIFIAVGIIALFLLKNKIAVKSAIASILILSFGNYFGIAHWTMPIRYYWPIYLSLLFGLGVLYILKFVIKKWKIMHSLILAVVLLVLFSNIYYEKPAVPGSMSKDHWDGLTWFRDNTPTDSKVYFVYGDVYMANAVLRNIHRVHYLVFRSSYLNAVQSGTIDQFINSKLLGDCCGVSYAYRNNLFSYGYHLIEDGGLDAHYKSRDMCDMDYYVIDKITSNSAITAYNRLIRDELLKNDWITEVHSNNIVSILKNNNPGDDCIG